MKVFKSGADFAFENYGSAKVNYSEEFESILKIIADKGSYIVWREKWLAYSPAKNKSGHLILDENASVAAMRHELQHLIDDESYGFPGLGWYMQYPAIYRQLKFRGYLAELSFAREKKDFDLARQIIENMRVRRFELLEY